MVIDFTNASEWHDRQGSDLSGVAGGDLFTPFVQAVPGSNAGAARTMSVAIVDPAKIAAAGPTSGPGSNANALLLAGLRDQPLQLPGNMTAYEFYANLIFTLGTDLKSAQDNEGTQSMVLQQLQNQRDAFSGVNLDDEAVNIIRYQKAYEASARFIKVVDTLTEQLIQIL